MVRIFIDFDGTITRQDVGDAMFAAFGGEASTAAIDRYRAGEISAVECFRRECHACGEVDQDQLDRFLDRQEIDPSFSELLAFAGEQGFACCVLSDGMDYYIDRILRRHGLHVPFFSNHLDRDPVPGSGRIRFRPSFPFSDEVCDRCACCKRNHMLTLSADDDVIVYVGEGYSDRCPARHADVVFAKDELALYCRQEGIPWYEYRTFADVVGRLRMLLVPGRRGKNGLRKRRQAEIARRAVFTGG